MITFAIQRGGCTIGAAIAIIIVVSSSGGGVGIISSSDRIVSSSRGSIVSSGGIIPTSNSIVRCIVVVVCIVPRGGNTELAALCHTFHTLFFIHELSSGCVDEEKEEQGNAGKLTRHDVDVNGVVTSGED